MTIADKIKRNDTLKDAFNDYIEPEINEIEII